MIETYNEGKIAAPDATAAIARRTLLAAGVGAAGLAALPPARAQTDGRGPATGDGKKRIVFVASNPAVSPANGMAVGYWLPELAHPYWAFQQAGYESDIASPNGGAIRYDEVSAPSGRFGNPKDFLSHGFSTSAAFAPLLEDTLPLARVRATDYDAIFVVGGLAPNLAFADHAPLHALFADFYESGKVTAALCHGSCILLKVRLRDGRLLAEGKRWTGFTNAEEDLVDKAFGVRFQPFRIEDEATKIGGTQFIQGPAYKPFAVADGRLITGQQGSSGAVAAGLVIKALAA